MRKNNIDTTTKFHELVHNYFYEPLKLPLNVEKVPKLVWTRFLLAINQNNEATIGSR